MDSDGVDEMKRLQEKPKSSWGTGRESLMERKKGGNGNDRIGGKSMLLTQHGVSWGVRKIRIRGRWTENLPIKRKRARDNLFARGRGRRSSFFHGEKGLGVNRAAPTQPVRDSEPSTQHNGEVCRMGFQ